MTELSERDLPFTWGRYRVLGVLGKGGFSRVYRAELQGPSGFRKPVALKVMTRLDDASRDAFMAEARLGARLHHPNVVEIYDVGETEGRTYIAMEMVLGPTVRALVRKNGPLPVAAALEVVGQVALAAHHAHELHVDGRALSVVHRDIKATNVILDPDGRAKLADFGIARTRDGAATEAVGTFGYMPPEQLRGQPADRRADIFALGVLLTYTVIGKLPWSTRPRAVYLQKMLNPIAALDESGTLVAVEQILPGLGAVLKRCLAAAPADRFATAFEFASELARLLDEAPIGATVAELVAPLMPGADSKVTPSLTFGRRRSGDSDVVQYRPPQTNIQVSSDRFVGRAAELGEVREHLARARVVTLIGPGGIGKTRLSREVGSSVLSEWAGGVWFCDLSSVHSVLGMLHEIADAVGAHMAATGDEDALIAQLGKALSAREPTLLILDNFEQVVQHAGIVSTWVSQALQVRFLVTSRERLRVADEHPVVLGPLELDDAVDLFAERARAARADFAMNPRERADIEALVAALDHMPLPIELAAARMRLMGVKQLRQALADRFRVLSSEHQDAPARQATLYGAIAWSWDLLQDWERAAFAQLSVFAAPFTVDAASAVLDLEAWPEAPWGMFAVEALIEKSLVRVISSADERHPVRLGMYVSLREFAAEKLETPGAVRTSGGADATGPQSLHAAQSRHGHWYVDSVAYTQRAPLELPDLVAATERALACSDLPLAAQAVQAAIEVIKRTGPFEVGLSLAAKTLATPGLDDVERLSVLLAKSELWVHARGVEGLQDSVDDAQMLALGLDMPGLITRALVLQARIAEGEFRHDDAWVTLELALRAARRPGAPQLAAATVQGHMVQVAVAQGRLTDAREIGESAWRTFAVAGDEREVASVIGALAAVAVHEARWADAEKLLSQAIIIEEGLGDLRAAMQHQCNIAHVFRMQGRTDEGEQVLRLIIPKQLALGDTRNALTSLVAYAVILRNQGEGDKALEVYRKALAEVGDDPEWRGVILGNMAAVYADIRDFREAVLLMGQAIEAFRISDGKRFLRLCSLNLAEILVELGDFRAAEVAIDEAVALGEKHGLSESKAAAFGLRAVIKAMSGDAIAARENLARLEDIGADSVLDSARTLAYRGRVAQLLEDGEELEVVLRALDDAVEKTGARPGTRLAKFGEDLRRERDKVSR